MTYPKVVEASIAGAERLGFVVSKVERGPVKTIEAGPDGEFETTSERVTVVFSRPDQADLPATFVLVGEEWVYASGIELPYAGSPRASQLASYVALIPIRDVRGVMGLFGKRREGKLEPLDYGGDDAVEVKGEAHYQDAFARIAGPKTDRGVDLQVTVTLRRDSSNPFDSNAVHVLVQDELVGFIGKDYTQLMTSCLDRIEATNPGRSVTVYGHIVGGWDRGGGDVGHYGIRLYVDAARLTGS